MEKEYPGYDKFFLHRGLSLVTEMLGLFVFVNAGAFSTTNSPKTMIRRTVFCKKKNFNENYTEKKRERDLRVYVFCFFHLPVEFSS